MKKQPRINIPFDVTYTISFSGRSKSDGLKTITPQIIRDKLLAVLEDLIAQEYIREYTISVERNNIQEAKKTLKKNK